jgi:glycosyltransferase involved in cell wall biosynthesis
MYIACRKVNGKFIMAMASDLDASGFADRYRYFYKQQKKSLWHIINGILIELIHPYLMRKADIILSQHEGQMQILERRRIHSFIFNNLFDVSLIPEIKNTGNNGFIYVSTYLNKRKGFVEFCNLVEQSPGHQFIIVGKPSDKIAAQYLKKIRNYENVTLLGKVNHKDSIVHIANSRALVTTSLMEGFPNIFLEAWAVGIPIISFIVDPGGIIAKNNLGLVCNGQLERLYSYIETFDQYNFEKDHLKNYVQENHSIEYANEKFLRIINS